MTNLPTLQQDVWTPATEADKLAALAALGSLPSRATSSAKLDKAGYFVALDSVTRYGLSTAVRSILQGALNHGFFPSPPELRKQCDAAMEHHERMAEKVRRRERENAEFNRIHGGPFPERTEDGRRRVQEAYRAYLDSHQSASESEMEAARAEIRARYGMTEEVLAGIKDRPTARQGA